MSDSRNFNNNQPFQREGNTTDKTSANDRDKEPAGRDRGRSGSDTPQPYLRRPSRPYYRQPEPQPRPYRSYRRQEAPPEEVSPEERLLRTFKESYNDETVFWELRFLVILIVAATITMTTLWWWSAQPWWVSPLAALVTGTLCYVVCHTTGRTPRLVSENLPGEVVNGQPLVRGLNRFNILHVFIITCFWIAIPHGVSYAILQLPDSWAIFALLRLLAKIMSGMAWVITGLCIANFIARLTEVLFHPFKENDFTARWLRPMMPCLRSDIRRITDFLIDLGEWLFNMVFIASVIILIWVGLTLIFDRDLLAYKYHYWPFRPDKELVIPEHRTFTEVATDSIEQIPDASKDEPVSAPPATTTPAKIKLTSMRFEEDGFWMRVGETRQLHLTVSPLRHDETINIVAPLNARQQMVLRLTGDLRITAMQPGECLVRAESNLSHKTAQVLVHVSE